MGMAAAPDSTLVEAIIEAIVGEVVGIGARRQARKCDLDQTGWRDSYRVVSTVSVDIGDEAGLGGSEAY